MKAAVDVQPELPTDGHSSISDSHQWSWCVFFSCSLIAQTFGGAILQSALGCSGYLMVVQLKPKAKIHFIVSGEYLVIFTCALESWRHKWWTEQKTEECTSACKKKESSNNPGHLGVADESSGSTWSFPLPLRQERDFFLLFPLPAPQGLVSVVGQTWLQNVTITLTTAALISF